MAKTIPLTRGHHTLVDDDVFEWASKFKWYSSKNRRAFYATRRDKNRNLTRLHREIVGAKPGEQVDHIDGDGLNNLRSNLRICTIAENSRNHRLHINSKTGLQGVTWNPRSQTYRAQIWCEGARQHLGCFDDAEQAARARDSAAIKYHGKYAALNFPQEVL